MRIVEHDHRADYQVCFDCWTVTGKGIDWPDETPYQDSHPDEFDEGWDGRCPVCGCKHTGIWGPDEEDEMNHELIKAIQERLEDLGNDDWGGSSLAVSELDDSPVEGMVQIGDGDFIADTDGAELLRKLRKVEPGSDTYMDVCECIPDEDVY